MHDKKKVIFETASRALKVRRELNIGRAAPVSIYDAAEERGAIVRFEDVSTRLEGIYQEPNILISALRPPGRQAFTCAHELGHHEYGHGIQVDEIKDSSFEDIQSRKEELIADTFAAHFLMPTLAIQNAFVKRKWDIKYLTAEQVYAVSKYFGVSYEGLIYHMTFSLRLINRPLSESLLKTTPKEIRMLLLGAETKNDFIPVDLEWLDRPIDLQVGDFVLLPDGAESAGICVSELREAPSGRLFQGSAPGEGLVKVPYTDWSIKIRVCKPQYVGLNRYRFEEDPEFV